MGEQEVEGDLDQVVAAVQALSGHPRAAVYVVEGMRVQQQCGDEAALPVDRLVRELVHSRRLRTVVRPGIVLAPAERDGHLIGVVAADWSPAEVPDGAAVILQALACLWASAQGDRDALTRLVGRRVLLDHLRLANSSAARSVEVPALLFCDLDGLKQVNDEYGHAMGDHLLRAVAQRITDTVRPADTVARVGGDEFVVLCPALADRAEAAVIAGRLHGVLAAEYVIGSTVVVAPASIGAAVGPFTDPEDGLRGADLAMYEAKRSGRGYALYDAGLQDAERWRLHVRGAFPEAITAGQLRLLFQPQFRLSSGRLTTVEALLRWQHPDRGLLGPDDFLPVIEGVRATAEALAAWVLGAACREAATWPTRWAGMTPPRVAVNVSPRQLAGGRLIDLVVEALRDSGLAADRLQVEVTETSLLADPVEAGRTLARLRELGVTIALDDFGVGYSSLALLRDLPVDVLKIDRSFTRDLLSDPRAESIVTAVIRLGHHLNASVCAEGVETDDQLSALRRAGCDDVQGYLLHSPTPGRELPLQPWIVPAMRGARPTA